MLVGFNLNVTYGLKLHVSSIKMVTVLYRQSMFQLRVTIPQGQHHVSSAQQSYALFGGVRNWMSDQLRIPRVVITSFFIPFRRRYLRLQNSPALCDVVLSISQLFVPHFDMYPFACIFTISYNRPNKQPDPSFEFFSILLTFGRLKQ